VDSATNQAILTLGLLGVGVYFSVLILRGILGLLLFRRVRQQALLTWRARPPAYRTLLMALGVIATALTVVTLVRQRPFFHVYSQAVMALYFMLMVPLAARIPRGLYGDGIWTDVGFLRYGRIKRMAFRETPDIVLILITRGRLASTQRMWVPPGEYGAVRKLLEEKVRAGVLKVDAGILGL
jgi:hypothetical protein